MIDHPTPELKIHEFHPDCTIVYDSAEDWCKHGSNNHRGRHLVYICRRCGLEQPSLGHFNVDCYNNRYRWMYGDWNVYPPASPVKNLDGHDIYYTCVIRDEFGYTFTKDELAEFHEDYQHKQFLERQRNRTYRNHYEDWMARWKHIPSYMHGYRQLSTFQERKLYRACQVDDESPRIRGRRSPSNLPDSWDSHYICYQRTWKKKKVCKQWMVNL